MIACKHYIFISTVSVYADFSDPSIDENSKLAPTDEIVDEIVDGTTYGPQKVLCEIEAAKHDCKVTILRPGLIVGLMIQQIDFRIGYIERRWVVK